MKTRWQDSHGHLSAIAFPQQQIKPPGGGVSSSSSSSSSLPPASSSLEFLRHSSNCFSVDLNLDYGIIHHSWQGRGGLTEKEKIVLLDWLRCIGVQSVCRESVANSSSALIEHKLPAPLLDLEDEWRNGVMLCEVAAAIMRQDKDAVKQVG